MNAVEVKKTASRQSDNGYIISFLFLLDDVGASLALAPLGTPYVMGLAEIDAVTAFVQEDEREKKKSWDDLKPSQQCGIMCKDTEFQKWFTEKHGSFVAEDIKGAVESFDGAIRDYLDIISRLYLDTNNLARARWNNLYAEYLADTRMPEVRG